MSETEVHYIALRMRKSEYAWGNFPRDLSNSALLHRMRTGANYQNIVDLIHVPRALFYSSKTDSDLRVRRMKKVQRSASFKVTSASARVGAAFHDGIRTMVLKLKKKNILLPIVPEMTIPPMKPPSICFHTQVPNSPGSSEKIHSVVSEILRVCGVKTDYAVFRGT